MMFNHMTRMQTWLLAGGLAVLLAASFLGGRLVAPAATPDADVHAPAPAPAPGDGAADEQAEVASREQVYYCSMHPHIRSNDPDATCPICGMNLVPMPVDAGADADAGDLPVLRLSDRAARLLDVQTTPVERRAAEAQVHFVGTLGYDETRVADVVARSAGYVDRLHADYQWMPVRRGELLAEIDSPAVTAAARELLVMRGGQAGRRNAASLDAARARLVRLGMSGEQIDAIIDTGELPRTYALRSPADGVVETLDARQGDRLDEGDRLLRVVDLSSLWLQMEAYESDLPWLRVGQTARFSLPGQAGETFEASVSFISPRVDERTRTARVRLEVSNADGRLKPGMFARGAVRAEVADDALLIPASAALLTGRRAVVYVRLPGGDRPTFEGRQVELGPRVGEHYVVRDGLEEGERVVTRGAFSIDSELQIRGRPSMMGRAEMFERATSVSSAADAGDDDAKPYPLDVCVVTGLPLGSMGEPVRHVHEGQEILFCCPACLPRFKADPDRYMQQIEDAAEAAPDQPAEPAHDH